MSRLLLGVDGGATKTIALIADGAGSILGAGRAGSSDIHSETPPGKAIDNVIASVREAMSAAGIRGQDLEGCVFGLCGADWPEDVSLYRRDLQTRLSLRAAPTVTNDAFNTLRAGRDDGVGVALVLGTGVAIAARGPGDVTWFSGERMERAGALELGQVIFDSIVRGQYADERRPAFGPAALRIFGVDSVEALVYAITRSGGTGYRSVARLAPALLASAHEGDGASQQIVREHSERVARYVRATGRRVGLRGDRRQLVLAGGLLRSPGSQLQDTIAASLSEYVVAVSRLEPVHGAVLMAADQCGLQPSTDALIRNGPPTMFFATEATD